MRATFSDTATSGDSGSASASRLTWMAGNSILGAAEEADKAWRDGRGQQTARSATSRRRPTSLDPATGAGQPNFSYGYTAQAVEVTVGRRHWPRAGRPGRQHARRRKGDQPWSRRRADRGRRSCRVTDTRSPRSLDVVDGRDPEPAPVARTSSPGSATSPVPSFATSSSLG
ncbi:MAG: hypothetical protein WKF58_11850 [Ilumatobacteraceae bacterium]